MSESYHVIDLFAGPGGLAEGFCASRAEDGSRRFRISLSVEKDEAAHKTLLLRAFLRQFSDAFPDEYYDWLNGDSEQPDWATLYPAEWKKAREEAQCLELGKKAADRIIDERLDAIVAEANDRCIVIGGPPCQAYSLAGRSRNGGNKEYKPEKDQRHFLYREYIRILERVNPALFVMENVKGIVSSSVNGQVIASRILEDLRNAGSRGTGYRLVALGAGDRLFDQSDDLAMRDFLVRAEDWGLPQARHRVIIIGIRKDLWNADSGIGLRQYPSASSQSVLKGLPHLRSGLSKEPDSLENWRGAVEAAYQAIIRETGKTDPKLHDKAVDRLEAFRARNAELDRTEQGVPGVSKRCPEALADWILDPRLKRTHNHEARTHIRSDLSRYLFASVFALVHMRSPKAHEFPKSLSPNHGNWTSGNFSDRFRVQLWSRPSTTVTSHISKDGHYFIHPDPLQCRSLTVREAARLQTFPDNYVFLGNRTQQYVQVGNAVPPFLARNIADVVWDLLQAAYMGEENLTKRVSSGSRSKAA